MFITAVFSAGEGPRVLKKESPRHVNFITRAVRWPVAFVTMPKEQLGTSEKQNFLDTPMGFVGANSIADVPLCLGLGFSQTIFNTLIFFTGATFAFFMAIFSEASALHFSVATVKASVPSTAHGAQGTPICSNTRIRRLPLGTFVAMHASCSMGL
jgi:hypothetical protein